MVGNAVKVMRIATDEEEKVMRIATDEEEEDYEDDGKDSAAKALGAKGGKARAEKHTSERRREIAREAAMKRRTKD